MLFFLGMMGFLQATFLPGTLFYKLFNNRKFSLGQFIGASFGISVVINYALVSLLVLVGFYKQSFLISLVVIELAIIFVLFRKDRLFSLLNHSNNDIASNDKNEPFKGFYLWGKILVVGVIIYATSRFFEAQVFSGHDAVVSWNKWAVDWANGTFVIRSRGYSQLMPAVWSIPYVMMGGGGGY